MFINILYWLILLLTLTFVGGCASYRQFEYITEEFEIPMKMFDHDYNQTWQAVIQIAKKYDLAFQSQEAGVLKTRWIDNTQELNFVDSFSSADSVKAAKFKLIINVVKGFKGTREVAKVTLFKRQMIEQDFLQGWKEIPSDGILEATLLYRLERILKIEQELRRVEELKEKDQIKEF